MTAPALVSLCCRCGAPRGYIKRAKGLCQACEAICPVCEERPRGRGGKHRAAYCNPCANALQGAAQCTPEGKARLSARLKARHATGPAVEMVRAAKARAKRAGLPFDLSPSDLDVPSHCPVLGVALRVGSRQEKEHAPSLDRLRPELGYVRGNVRVISYRANSLRKDATAEELEAVLRYVRGIK